MVITLSFKPQNLYHCKSKPSINQNKQMSLQAILVGGTGVEPGP